MDYFYLFNAKNIEYLFNLSKQMPDNDKTIKSFDIPYEYKPN